MGIPVGYRKITSNDVGKTFGVNLETVIKFDDAISVGYWCVNAEPPFNEIVWMEFSDYEDFHSSIGGNPSFWMIDTFFRGSVQSVTEGSYPNPDNYIGSTSETVPSGVTITRLWSLDKTWMNYVYVKDKEPDPEYVITFNGNGGTSPNSQTTINQKLTTLPTPTRTGYQFSGWYIKTFWWRGITTSTVFSANTTVYAQWIPVGYRKITSDDVGKTFGVNLETVIKFDDAISVGYWYAIVEPPFNSITWMELNGYFDFYSDRTGDSDYWEIVTYFGNTTPSETWGAYPNIDDYIYDTSASVPSGTTITSLWTLDKTWMNNVYVKDKEPEYTITFNGNGGTSPNSQTTTNQKLTSLPSSTRTGFDFQGWYTATSGGTKITTSTVFSANTTVYAQWKPVYTITFNGNGGTSPNSQMVGFIEGYKLASLPSSTRTGFDFQGWYTATSGGTKITTSTVFSANTTVYAQWKPIYTITFNGNGGTSPNSQSVHFDGGYKLTSLPSSTRTNYVFQGWYTATSGGTKITTTTVFSANTTVYAQWKGEAYTVQFYGNGGGTPSPSSKTVYFGEVYGPLATVYRSAYSFVGWFSVSNISGGTQVIPSTVVTTTSPKKLYARWSLTTYTVTYNSNGGTSVSKTFGVTALPTSLPVTTKTGYDFVGWFYEPLLQNQAFGGDALTQNITLYAGWTQKTYTVVFKNWDETVLKTQTVSHGGNATAPANPTKDSTPQYNYIFKGWNKVFTNVTQNLDITAEYRAFLRFYDIGWKANGGKFSNNSTILTTNHKYGTTPEPNLTLSRESTAKYHYNTYAWTPPITTVTGEKVYTADWDSYKELRSYNVVFKDWNETVLKTQSVPYGSSATPPSNPTRPQNDEFTYTFSGWVGTYTNITGPVTIYAYYTATTRSYTITWSGGVGSTLDYSTSSVEYGTIPTPPGGTKTGYNLTGWSPTIVAVTGATTYTAIWTKKTYTVKFFDYDPVNRIPGVQPIKTESVLYQENATPPPNPTFPGFDFDKWLPSYEEISSNLNIYANYKPKLFTLTIETDIALQSTTVSRTSSPYQGAGTTIIDNKIYYGDVLSISAVAKTGYNNPTVTSPVTVQGNIRTIQDEYVIVGTKKTYIIIYELNGGTNNSGNPSTYNVETPSITFLPPTKTGYNFVSWSTTGISKGSTGNKTTTASWTPKTYTITYNLNGGTNNSGNPSIYNIESSLITFLEPTKTGYDFVSWSTTNIPAGSTGNKTTTASWTPKTYTIIYNLNGGTNNSGNPTTYNIETPSITFLPPTKTGYDFVSWTVTGISKGSTGNKTTTASWTPKTYTITYNLNGGTNNSGNPSIYNIESSLITFLEPTKTGYDFVSWSTTNIPAGSTGNKTTTASWTPKTYTIIYNLNGGTNNSGNPTTYNIETPSITFLPPTKTGYDFVSWTVTGISKGSTGNKTTTASWTPKTYSITWIHNDGTGNSTTTTEYYNVLPTPPSLERVGYDFVRWSPTIVAATEDKTYTAYWTPKIYNITYNLNGGTNNPNNPSTYNIESPPITFLKPTKTGYDFISWSITKIPTGSTGNKTTTASWEFINVPNLNSIANDCAFNDDNQYLVVAHETTPYVTIYKLGANDTFIKMNLTAPAGKAESCAFSPDGRYLAIGHQNAPGLTIYKKGTGDNFTKPTISGIEENIALSCTFSKDSKYLAVTHLNAPYVTIYEIEQADVFTKMNALSSPDGDQGSGSSSSFSDENEYLAITYNNSPYVAVIKAQRNANEKHTYLLNNSFSTVSALLDTPLIELGYASESGSSLENKKVKLIWR